LALRAAAQSADSRPGEARKMSLNGDVYGKRTLDFVERLKRLDEYDAVCRDITAEVKWFGYDYVTSWSMPGPGTDQATCLLINTRPQQYIERYIERNYVIRDPVVTELRHTQNPFSWGDLRERRNLSKSEKTIMDEGREFGSRDGFMVPIVSPSGSLAAFSVCGGEPDLSARARAAMELIGMYSMQVLRLAADKKRRQEPPRRPLTQRERQIMHYVAAGRSDDEIAEILSLSTRAVTWHVENAKRKLGAYRRTYAVVQALRFGEISL
jgi:LuxR family quorum sensing-dependent transcriptional regulator